MDSANATPPVYTINKNFSGLKASATLAINEQCQHMVDKGEQVFRLGFGQSPFPVPDTVVDALKKNAFQKAYLPVQGLLELREGICQYFKRTEQLAFNPEQVLVGPGTKELMYILQSVVESELVLPSPSWVSYAPQAQILGREITWLPGSLSTDPDLVPAALEQLCAAAPVKPRLLVLNYPINPTGGSYTADQLEKIAEVARRYKILVLSDEIYSGLHFKNQHISIARFYPEGTIISNGLSKWCGAGGWRLGAFVFPKELQALRETMTVLATETFSAVSSPVQYAAIEAFKDSADINSYLLQARRVLEQLLGYGYSKLSESGAALAQPCGGFYLFPNVDDLRQKLSINTSVELCSKLLLETGVAVLPGEAFGRPAQELSMRIALVDFDGAAALAAAKNQDSIDEEFIRRYCPKTVEAIDRLCAWLGR